MTRPDHEALTRADCGTCGTPASEATGGRHAVTREGTARTGYTYGTQCVACWNASVEAYRREQAAMRASAPKCEGCGRGQQSYILMPGTGQATALCRGCKSRVDARIRIPLLFGAPSATRAQILTAAREGRS